MWFDRYSGKKVVQLPDFIEPSRFICCDVFLMNGHSDLLDGDLLVDDGSGRLNSGSLFSSCEHDADKAVQDDLIFNALKEFERASSIGEHASFLLPEKLLTWLHLTELDRSILHVIERGHFHEIVRAPKLDLTYSEHLLPVGRVKRIPSSATRHLAAHSECWQKRSFTGIVPKTLLALESEDEYKIYENKVFARLLDHLEAYLYRRCREVECIEEALEKREKLDGSDIYWQARDAICGLWGEGFQHSGIEQEEADHGLNSLRTLRLLLKNIRGLKESRVYREIPPKDDVGFQVRMTNTLTHDQHYRHVARLWHKWSEGSKQGRIEPKLVFVQNQEISRAYFSYCHALIHRALKELGYDSDGGRATSDKFSGIKNRVDRGNLEIEFMGKRLTFVPIMGELHSSSVETNDRSPDRVILSPQFRSFDLFSNAQTASPSYFYTLEAMVSRISSWVATQSLFGSSNALEKSPSSVIELFKKNYSDYVHVARFDSRLVRPVGEILDEIDRDLGRLAKVDSSIKQFVKRFDEHATAKEELLRCPACGKKSRVEDYKERDSSGFEIASKTCDHEWRLDKDKSSANFLVVLPAREKNSTLDTDQRLQRYGRFSWRKEIRNIL